MWMVSYVVDIALSVTHLGKFIRGHFYLVIGILNFAFKYGQDRIEQKQLRDSWYLSHCRILKCRHRCRLAYSTKITWCIFIYRIIPLQVHNINYDNIYYILENFWTPKSKNWVNKRYLNTINCLTMAKNAYLSYLRINVLIAIHFYSIYQLNS